jgi:hypothetical protein
VKRFLFLIAIPFALAGCQPPVWSKPGASQADFASERYQCMQGSQQQSSSAYLNRYGGFSSSEQTTNGPLFDACMNAKGWALIRPTGNDKQILENKVEIETAKSSAREKALALCAEPKFTPYYAKTPCLAPQITFEQLADTSKISAATKAIFVELRGRLEVMAQESMDSDRRLFGAKGERAGALFLSTIKPRSDQLNLDLYNGQITWGEYNKRRQAIYVDYQEGLKKL